MNVSFLLILEFIAVVVYINLMAITLYRNPRNRLNQVAALFVACFLFWGGSILFIWNPDLSDRAVFLADKIGSLGWMSFASFFLWFALVLTENKALLRRKIFYLINFLVPVVLIVINYREPFRILVPDNYYVWSYIWANSIGAYAFFAYYLTFFSLGLFLLFRHYRRVKITLYKKQTLIIMVTSLISLITGTFADVILPIYTGMATPSFGSMLIMFWILGMFYAINNYRLLDLSFTLAGQNIISNISDNLFLLDKEGRIVDVNNQALNFLQLDKASILHQPLADFFRGETTDAIRQMISQRTSLINRDTIIVMKSKVLKPVLLSCSLTKGDDGMLLGWVAVISDISHQQEAAVTLAAKNEELETKLDELEKFQKIIMDRESKMAELKIRVDELRQQTGMAALIK